LVSDRLDVLIVGNSVPILVVPPRASRDEGTYGERLGAALAERDVPATVVNEARLFELVTEGSRRYHRELVSRFPDVLVIHYGVLEQQPNVAPFRLVRYMTRGASRAPGLRGLWRRNAVDRFWPLVRRWQQWGSARAGTRLWRVSPARFREELLHIVRLTRPAGTLVLVVDVHRPNERLEYFMPGITRRWEAFQAMLREAVASVGDPDVRLVESSKVVDGFGDTGGTADGLHLTAAAHAALADVLADEIIRWRQP
jgi:lysophospholipase L1-like esterase